MNEPGADGRKVVVYGTGSAAEQLLGTRGEGFTPDGFATTGGGGEFRGMTVITAAQLAAWHEADIVIASGFLTPIIETLRRLGVETQRIWWYFSEQDRLIPFDALGVTPSRDEILYAFYDLAMNPSTFDSAVFAVRADAERQRRGLKYLHFTIVPSAISGGRPGDLELLGGLANVAWRQSYILGAVFRLVPATRGVTALASRADTASFVAAGAACFPVDYDPARPTDEHIMKYCYDDKRDDYDPRVLRAPAKAVDFVRRFIDSRRQGRRLLVLTLREYAFQPDRNNDMAAWGNFLRSLDPATYYVVVVRDTDSVYTPMPEPLEGFDDLPLASIDVNIRLALYEAAYLNLTVTTGPGSLICFSARTRYLMFKQFLPQYVPTGAEFHLARNGMSIGDEFPLAGPLQKWVWQLDTAEIIRTEFDAMVQKIESNENAYVNSDDDAR